MQDREVSLMDLLVEILLRWRVLIVWMLVGGVLMGGFGYVRSYRTAQAQKAKIAEEEKKLQEKKDQLGENEAEQPGIKGTLAEREYLQEQMTDTQISEVDNVLNWESFIEEKKAYYNESILMKIDSLNIPQMQLTFLVIADSEEKSNSIELIYEDMISVGLLQWIADNSEKDISTGALSELITLGRSSQRLISGGDSFSVTVIHETEEQCKELAGLVAAYISQQHKLKEQELGAHDILLVNEAYSVVNSTTLMDDQRTVRNDITTWESSIAKMKEAFKEEEWKYYNFLTTGKAIGAPDKNSVDSSAVQDQQGQQSDTVNTIVVTKPSVSVKYIILGMVLLAFIYVFYVFVMYILNNKLRADDDVSQIYGVPQLGLISKARNNKRLLPFVDNWILGIRNRGKRRFSEEEAIGLAAVAVKISAKREELNAVYCIGCNLRDSATEVSDKIQAVLKKEGIDMAALNNVLYNQEAMEQLQEAKGAFLLEKAGETFYDEIARELELLHRQEIKVLGIVVVE